MTETTTEPPQDAPAATARPLSTLAAHLSGPVPAYLKHLPTDKRGFPVPHVADWQDESPAASSRRRAASGEDDSSVDVHAAEPTPPPDSKIIDTTRWGGHARTIALWPTGEQGKGAPRLAVLNPARQLQCMTERRCQVCSRLIGTSERIVFMGGNTATQPADTPVTFREPPLHRKCAVYALFACPGINMAPIFVIEADGYALYPDAQFVVRGARDENGDVVTVNRYDRWPLPNEGFITGAVAVPLDGTVFKPAEYREANAALLDTKPKPQKGKRRR